MTKLDMFFAVLSMIFMALLIALTLFVTYIYYDACLVMKDCMTKYKVVHEYHSLNDGWKEITFEEVT